MKFFSGGFCSSSGCWLVAFVLGTWVKLMVLSLVLDWTDSEDGFFKGGFCFGGGCWLVASVVDVGYLGRVVGVDSVVGLWFNGGSGWFGSGNFFG